MSSMNHVIVLGGLTRDPELRHTGGGQAICKFSLALTDVYKDKSGKEVKSTCYVDIDAWGKLGETIAKHLRKGSQALVQGRLQMEQWDAKDGTKRTKLSLRAFDVQFMGRPSGVIQEKEFEDGYESPSPMGSSSGPQKPRVHTGGKNDEDDEIVPF
ncbi:MAG TPA: single-stranded DNA-binding protein [Kiritimatiellia bacterium]|nr:single-stranded DNA-binding protein [Kiritimatiellia bacterium]HMO98507.1 single-stranded DNA-binding protein [Kiritimatiellia bacterium]HMP95815.1 single-stranded DNA-binding protein [Kiritimatiellia bacterium]